MDKPSKTPIKTGYWILFILCFIVFCVFAILEVPYWVYALGIRLYLIDAFDITNISDSMILRLCMVIYGFYIAITHILLSKNKPLAKPLTLLNALFIFVTFVTITALSDFTSLSLIRSVGHIGLFIYAVASVFLTIYSFNKKGSKVLSILYLMMGIVSIIVSITLSLLGFTGRFYGLTLYFRNGILNTLFNSWGSRGSLVYLWPLSRALLFFMMSIVCSITSSTETKNYYVKQTSCTEVHREE